MNVTREMIDEAEARLDFEPAAVRRALAERAPVADAQPREVQKRLAHALGEGPDAADLAVERILTGADQLNVNFLERGMIAADAVACLEIRSAEEQLLGYATGFMVSPQLLMTNHHVLPSAEVAAQSWADFRWEYDAYGRALEPVSFALDPARFYFADPELDVALVALAPRDAGGDMAPASFGWLRLHPGTEKALPGEWLSVVHHPHGRPKQLTVRQCQLLRRTPCHLWYGGTTGYSSGAPLCNDSWQVVALHSTGVPKRDASGAVLTVDGERWIEGGDESRVLWQAGLGARVSAIVRRVDGACGGHPLVQEMLREGQADTADAVVVPLGSGEPLVVESPQGSAPMPPVAAAPEARTNGGSTPPTATVPPLAPPVQPLRAPVMARSSERPRTSEAITVTIPLRITVRPGNGSGHGAAVGVDLE